MSEPRDTFTTKQLAKRWQVSPETVRRYMRSGKLKCFSVGGYKRVPAEEVERYERESMEHTAA